MKFLLHKSIVRKVSLVALTAIVVLIGSVLQTQVLRVRAAVDVLLVSDTAIPFGTVFPGEMLSKTYTVQLDTSVSHDAYTTTLTPVAGQLDLCPLLQVTSVDVPAEADTLGSATLSRPGDSADNWQVQLMVPGIQGHISQNHEGEIVISGGDYGCRITISTGEGGEITGMKFNDLNRNRRKDLNEPGLPGWTIRLDELNGGLATTTVTASDGTYSFVNLPDGTYSVREVAQIGWRRTTRNPRPIVIEEGNTVRNVDFGNIERR
ncbi:MAG: SdrD B-like domain-containing protein [bacterium]|nr:SdrD B-like domain-containing protein [bacterium]MDZ4284821.1 SdrD B-like domain-containing protein [Patescibacteria group bacterium]